jgi:hypothetical protein
MRVVSFTRRPIYPWIKNPQESLPTLQEAGLAPEPVLTRNLPHQNAFQITIVNHGSYFV